MSATTKNTLNNDLEFQKFISTMNTKHFSTPLETPLEVGALSQRSKYFYIIFMMI